MDQPPAQETNPIPEPQPLQPPLPEQLHEQFPQQPPQPEHPDQSSAPLLPKKGLFLLCLATVILVTIGSVAFIYSLVGQREYEAPQPQANKTTSVRPSSTPEIEPDIAGETITALIMDKKNAFAIEYCNYPWDYKPIETTPADKECIEAEMSGNIKKTFHGANPPFTLIYSNINATEEQYASASATALRLYQQLIDPSVFEWLQKPKVPPVGSTYSHIKLHAMHKGDYEVIGTYTVTVDQAPASSKVRQVIEEMNSLAK